MAAPYIIPAIGDYWRNIESEHPTDIKWAKGSTYTYEFRRESCSNEPTNRQATDYTANTEHIATGYAWNQVIGAQGEVNPVLSSSQEFTFSTDPFNDQSVLDGLSAMFRYNTIGTQLDFPSAGGGRPIVPVDFDIGQDVLSSDSVVSATEIDYGDLLIQSFTDAESIGHWTKYSVTISTQAYPGNYDLVAIRYTFGLSYNDDFIAWTVSDLTQVDYETANVAVVSFSGNPAPFPPSRPDDYDPDDHWDPKIGGGVWTPDPWDLVTLGGGRYNQQLVVLGHRKIYFEGLE